MTILFERLKPGQRRGSKPRCHLLTHGSPDAVATRLTGLVAPFASVAPSDRWMPQGFEDTDEATLPEAERLLPSDVRSELKRWWLVAASNNTRTPNWDVACACTIEGKSGIVLIEAKAHDQELSRKRPGRKNIEAPVSGNARRNLMRIDWAIRDVVPHWQRILDSRGRCRETGTIRCRTDSPGLGSWLISAFLWSWSIIEILSASADAIQLTPSAPDANDVQRHRRPVPGTGSGNVIRCCGRFLTTSNFCELSQLSNLGLGRPTSARRALKRSSCGT